jgi:hypothetical protein
MKIKKGFQFILSIFNVLIILFLKFKANKTQKKVKTNFTKNYFPHNLKSFRLICLPRKKMI